MKISVLYTKTFLKSVKGLPKGQQTKLAYLLEILQNQSFDSKLHTKLLTGRLTGFIDNI